MQSLISADIQGMTTSHYHRNKNRKVEDMMKDELAGRTMSITKVVALTVKTYGYRKIDKKMDNKHCKDTKKCVIAESRTLGDCKTCVFDGKAIYRK